LISARSRPQQDSDETLSQVQVNEKHLSAFRDADNPSKVIEDLRTMAFTLGNSIINVGFVAVLLFITLPSLAAFAQDAVDSRVAKRIPDCHHGITTLQKQADCHAAKKRWE